MPVRKGGDGLTFSETLDRTIRLYRAHFKPLITIGMITGILQLPLVFAFQPVKPGTPPEQTFTTAMAIAGVLAMFAWPLQYGALTKAAFEVIEGRATDVASALRAALRRYWAVLGAGFLAVLASAGGMLLLIVPGFYILLGFALATVAIVGEDRGPIEGLRRSWALAAGRRGRIFGVFVVWTLLQLVLSYGLSGLFRLVGLGDRGATLAQTLASIGIVPSYCISLAFILIEARERRDGSDLEREAQRLAGAAPGAPTA